MLTAGVKAGRPQTAGTTTNTDAIIAAVEIELCIRSQDIAREIGLTQMRVVEVHLDRPLDPQYTSLSAEQNTAREVLVSA